MYSVNQATRRIYVFVVRGTNFYDTAITPCIKEHHYDTKIPDDAISARANLKNKNK